VERAYRVAERLHEGQKRASGEDYIVHPLMVAYYLAELHMDGPSIAAGLLHDVLEDTQMSREEFAEIFPAPIPAIVQGVTKISKLNFRSTAEAQVENLRMMILAMAKDIRVLMVKLCDRLHNMKTLKSLSADKRVEISQETLDIYAPLANRLGMARIKIEMEDLAMRWLQPEAYADLSDKIAKKKRERERHVRDSIQVLKNYLNRLHPELEITGRPKHFYSIYKKMKAEGLTFEQIYDLNALRVICDSAGKCYEIMGQIHSLWPPLPGRIKDYIGLPKKNMYQSLHTTVVGHNGAVTEIQIRTASMHDVAEFGIAAHWKYKEGVVLQNDERLTWLRQLAEWLREDHSEPNGLFATLKEDVFADRVLCFTPAGDVIDLPAGSTPIDFAFAIHSTLGEKCVGAKINQRMVNLRTKLQNADVVEIQKSESGHPSRDWLDYVKSRGARQKIKAWLKSRDADHYATAGRDGIQKVLQARRLSPAREQLEDALLGLVTQYKMQGVSDLLVEIGFGTISAAAAVARMDGDWIRKAPPQQPAKATAGRKIRTEVGPIIVEGAEGSPIRIANCCSPIPGTPIEAFITRGRGFTIHSQSCKSMARVRNDPAEAARLLPAYWNLGADSVHTTVIRIVSEDRAGLLTFVSGILSRHEVFIVKSATDSDEKKRTATLLFQVHVKSADHLRAVMDSLRAEDGVITVERRLRF